MREASAVVMDTRAARYAAPLNWQLPFSRCMRRLVITTIDRSHSHAQPSHALSLLARSSRRSSTRPWPLHCRGAPNTRQWLDNGQCSTAALDRRHGTAREPRGRPYAHLGRIQSPHGEISHIDRIQAPHAPDGTPTCTPRHRQRAGSHVMRCSRRGAVARHHRARVAAATGQTLRPADAGTTTGLRLA